VDLAVYLARQLQQRRRQQQQQQQEEEEVVVRGGVHSFDQRLVGA